MFDTSGFGFGVKIEIDGYAGSRLKLQRTLDFSRRKKEGAAGEGSCRQQPAEQLRQQALLMG